MPTPVVLVGWSTGSATALAARLAGEVLGRHPGPLHHTCPTCGSIEHGRPSFDAPVAVSLAHAPGLHLAAASTAGPVGVDLEPTGTAERSWVRTEAIGKARGTGVVVPVSAEGVQVLDLAVPGHLAALAVLAAELPAVRTLAGAPAARSGPATR